MHRTDFVKLIGGESKNNDYLPVACLLENGYGCAGYFVASLNEELAGTCVLVNARLIDLHGPSSSGRRGAIEDFNEFIEEIVTNVYSKEDGFAETFFSNGEQTAGQSIPLMALDYGSIVLVYPVSHISTLMRRVVEDQKAPTPGSLPSFLDFDRRSVVLKLLRTKLW